jgi:hypothetical protein
VRDVKLAVARAESPFGTPEFTIFCLALMEIAAAPFNTAGAFKCTFRAIALRLLPAGP